MAVKTKKQQEKSKLFTRIICIVLAFLMIAASVAAIIEAI